MTGKHHVQPNQVYVLHRRIRGGSASLAGAIDRRMGLSLADLANGDDDPIADSHPDGNGDLNAHAYLRTATDDYVASTTRYIYSAADFESNADAAANEYPRDGATHGYPHPSADRDSRASANRGTHLRPAAAILVRSPL